MEKFPASSSDVARMAGMEAFIRSRTKGFAKRRLEKVHTASKRAWPRSNWQWKELDCANSSDALLMNIFCHPEAMESAGVRAMLGIESNAVPEFGYKARTPLLGNLTNEIIDSAVARESLACGLCKLSNLAANGSDG
jgi:hypothetical protein